ncbi:hypothetical protein EBP14_25580, partial [Salmonella enterica subsp. enterica serovar Vitkin]|nr:hypothetical protein [Salmonella enterica subsp. enterica serovar Vitkin]
PGGTDPWPRAPVEVDIPRLTLYIGPVWNASTGGPDTGFAREPDGTMQYGDAACTEYSGARGIAVSGYRYVYTSETLGMAKTPLVGTATERSDYNFGPGETLAGRWVDEPAGNDRTVAADSPGTPHGAKVILWGDRTHDTDPDPNVINTAQLSARPSLAPVSAPNADVNYVAGWRHGTSDHSVAMINVKAGATAGTAMTQPNGAGWAAGGIVCVLDRQ